MADAEVTTQAEVHAAKVEVLRKELEFIKRLSNSSKTVEGYVAAARAAVKVATRATNELQGLFVLKDAVVTIRNVPQNWAWSKVRELLSGFGITPGRVDKSPSWNLAIVMLRDAVAKAALLAKVHGLEVEGQTLQVVEGAPPAEEMAVLQSQARGAKRALDVVAGVSAKARKY